MPSNLEYFPIEGGLLKNTPLLEMPPGSFIEASNVEMKMTGGVRRLLGYAKFDTNEVTGEGKILGVWYYGGKCYAFRNAVGGATAVMWESAGSGWTSKKTGLNPDGSYEFVTANIDGSASSKMYGVDGQNKAFEWDGTTWTDLTTGMSPDTPDHVIAHKNHLFLAFGPSLQFSALGDPDTWSVVSGAGEMITDTDISGMMQVSGGDLTVLSRNSTMILKGSSSADFTAEYLVEHGNKIGAIPKSIQQLGSRLRYLDDRGVIDLATSDQYGDFVDASLSFQVDDIIQSKKDQVTASCIVRDKSQYRLFFNDGTGLIFSYRGDEQTGITPMAFPDVVQCCASVEDTSGDEIILFGSDDGYIYQMESGNDFGGDNIVAYFRTAYSNYGELSRIKRYRRIKCNMKGAGSSTITVKADATFADISETSSLYKTISVTGESDVLGYGALGSFILSTNYLIEGAADLNAHGDYISLQFYNSSTGESPWEIDGITAFYSTRRLRRG